MYSVRISVEIPQDEIKEVIREAGYEPTADRYDAVCEEMQCNYFDDTCFECCADEVEGYIIGTAAFVVEGFAMSGEWDEETYLEKSGAQ